jgi:hypothetical protein
MTLNLVNYQNQTKKAVRAFWRKRDEALNKQIKTGKVDAGGRGSVTAGKNMDDFRDMIEKLIKANGLSDVDIQYERRLLTLPGFFRPTKQWDMLVLNNGILVAALEFKSQVGPSFGNNFNNRAEEAIGTAHDFWTVYREGAFGRDAPKPFVGWFMLLEDAPASRSSVRDYSPHFDLFPEFESASYADRYNILCRKLVQEQLYSAASVILSSRSAINTGKYTELSELTGLKNFVTRLAGHVASETARVSG